jgi:hypothetical protein
MERVADFLIASLDLVEAQSQRMLRRGVGAVRHTGASLALLVLALGGVGFLLGGAFLLLQPPLGAAGSALIVGLLTTSAATIGFLALRWRQP